MGVIPNPKMAFIFPISCILALIFPILIKYFPKCVGEGSFPKSQIKSLGSLCSRAGWFESHFFGNAEDRFCRDEAQMKAGNCVAFQGKIEVKCK